MLDASPMPPSPAELFDLTGARAIVTGASSGLGVRFARLLRRAGATVVVAARRADRLRTLYDAVPGFEWVECDIADAEDRARLFDRARRDGFEPEILVNNAAISGPLAASDEAPSDFASLLEVNLTSSYALAREMVGASTTPRQMSIINVSSILGIVAGAPVGGAGYAASKAGLIGLTRELAAQWGPMGVRVNALAPGWFETEMTEALLLEDSGQRWIRRNTMLGRPGDPSELDTALLLLASRHSSYFTGQVLVVDGGWTAR
jgi:NAD(P)-dependent dehydrogenase (short-subunit alcohol dehydrogenase family)